MLTWTAWTFWVSTSIRKSLSLCLIQTVTTLTRQSKWQRLHHLLLQHHPPLLQKTSHQVRRSRSSHTRSFWIKLSKKMKSVMSTNLFLMTMMTKIMRMRSRRTKETFHSVLLPLRRESSSVTFVTNPSGKRTICLGICDRIQPLFVKNVVQVFLAVTRTSVFHDISNHAVASTQSRTSAPFVTRATSLPHTWIATWNLVALSLSVKSVTKSLKQGKDSGCIYAQWFYHFKIPQCAFSKQQWNWIHIYE